MLDHATRRWDQPVGDLPTHLHQPPTTWGVRGIDEPIRATVDLTVEPRTETQSRLTISVDFEGHGIGKILGRREAQKEMPANLAMLKQRLETTAERHAVPYHLSEQSSSPFADPEYKIRLITHHRE
jgi:hypothetical protein